MPSSSANHQNTNTYSLRTWRITQAVVTPVAFGEYGTNGLSEWRVCMCAWFCILNVGVWIMLCDNTRQGLPSNNLRSLMNFSLMEHGERRLTPHYWCAFSLYCSKSCTTVQKLRSNSDLYFCFGVARKIFSLHSVEKIVWAIKASHFHSFIMSPCH